MKVKKYKKTMNSKRIGDTNEIRKNTKASMIPHQNVLFVVSVCLVLDPSE
jgi:hypothetical protein